MNQNLLLVSDAPELTIIEKICCDFIVEKVVKTELVSAAAALEPDLIILDNSLELCEVLKQNTKTKNISVVIVSDNAEDSIKAFSLGCLDFISPEDPKELLERIRRCLRLSRIQRLCTEVLSK